jgi:P4 family phage/plasmid primase-like protien
MGSVIDKEVDTNVGGVDRVNSPMNIANILKANFDFAKDKAERLYFYDNGVYHPNAENLIIKPKYQDILTRWGSSFIQDWRAYKAEETVKSVLAKARLLWDKPQDDRINLLNGIYDFQNMVLNPHTPDWLSTVQVPIKYDPDALCPEWDKFISEVLPEGDTILREIIGLCMTPFTGIQQCIVLVGSGANGKSTFSTALETAIGKSNVSHESLHDLVEDRFSRASLVGKLANVFSDLPLRKILDASNFKALTGEDTVMVEYKHAQKYAYTPFCKLIFSCNEMVKSDDSSVGYKRRLLCIPFSRTFVVNPKKGRELIDTLTSEGELSGLLNSILPKLEGLIENGFTISPELAAIIDNYIPLPNNVKTYFENYIVVGDDLYVTAEKIYSHYCSHIKGLPGGESFTNAKFINYLRAFYSNIRIGVTKRAGSRFIRCHMGIGFKDTTEHSKMLEDMPKYRVNNVDVFEKPPETLM